MQTVCLLGPLSLLRYGQRPSLINHFYQQRQIKRLLVIDELSVLCCRFICRQFCSAGPSIYRVVFTHFFFEPQYGLADSYSSVDSKWELGTGRLAEVDSAVCFAWRCRRGGSLSFPHSSSSSLRSSSSSITRHL